MKSRRFFISVFFVSLYFLVVCKVQAVGSVSLSSSMQSVNVGDTFSVSVNLSGVSVASLTARVGFDSQKVEFVSGSGNSNASGGRVLYTWTDPSGGASPITGGTIATFTFRAKSEGSAAFSVSGDFFTPDEVAAKPSFSGATVSVKRVESNPGGGTETNPGGGTGTNPGVGTGTNSGGGTGAKPGENTGNNPGAVQNNKSSNNNLKSLQLNVEGISPSFNKNITQYYLILPKNINDINVTANAEDSKATVKVTGNSNIPVGKSKISIVVTAENGSRKEYVINVTKTSNPELSNSNLENLAIEGATLVPEFSADVTDYKVEFFGDLEKLNILAVPQRESATVTIEGNENLQYGENFIKITVLAEDGTTSKIYNIVVNKQEKQDEAGNMENQDNMNNVDDNRLIENVENKVDEKTKVDNWIWFAGLGILGIVIIVIIVIVWRKKKKI